MAAVDHVIERMKASLPAELHSYVDAYARPLIVARLATKTFDGEDVTESAIADLRSGRYSGRFQGLRAAGSLTPRKMEILRRANGMRLGHVSNALVYDDKFRGWRTADHKSLLEAALGGFLRVLRVPGSLRGLEPDAGGAGSDSHVHYRLVAVLPEH